MSWAVEIAALIGSLSVTPLCEAANDTGPAWTFGGFGTIGVTHANTRQADFTSSIMKSQGAGYTDSWSPNVDSRIAVQAAVALDHQWSAVVQIVSEQNLDSSYRPKIEWANIQYRFTPDLSLRVGRIAVPMFLVADYRKVGYAYTFVRPPAEVYNAIPFTNSDGVDLNFRWRGGGFTHNDQVFYGRFDLRSQGGHVQKVRRLTGFSHTAVDGPLTLQFGILTATLASDGASPATALAGPSTINTVSQGDIHNTALTMGAAYDLGAWFVTGEAGLFDSRALALRIFTGYAMAGFRWKTFSPYVTIARTTAQAALQNTGFFGDGGPAFPPQGGPFTSSPLGTHLSPFAMQTSIGSGIRWDLGRSRALKLQYDHVRPHAGSSGTLINVQPGFRPGQSICVVSAVLDFVF